MYPGAMLYFGGVQGLTTYYFPGLAAGEAYISKNLEGSYLDASFNFLASP